VPGAPVANPVDEELIVADAQRAQRTDSIEREMEEARDRLASTIDQLAYRTNPKTIVRREVAAVKATFVDADGNPRTENILKVAGGVAGFVAVLVIIRRVTR
jgi:Protein of unknown function (DUF3618)